MTFIHKTITLLRGSLPKKLFYSFALLLLIAIFSFCIFYFTSDHNRLKDWYFSLNDCFYNQQYWTERFFTPAVKARGNDLALAGIGISVLLILSIAFSWRRNAKKVIFTDAPAINDRHYIWYLAVVVLALITGIWSWCSLAPAYDEVFSAVNCAELHPFQTISYYMLPNNHIYFNFINNILFRWWGDPVQSGRFISLVSHVGILLLAYHWLYRLINNYFYSFLALLPIALQFTAWGMAAQARGYELELLCAWVSFTTMFRYALHENDRMLRLNTLFSILGFLLVSTYLLYYVTQTIVLLCVMAYNRRLHWRYYKYQLYIVSFVFLLYLPAFCFSGIAAFTENGYVKPAFDDWVGFLPVFADTLKFFINFCFGMLFGGDTVVNFVVFLLPLILFLSKRKERRLIAFSYLILWIVYIIITLNMRHDPYNRNMIMHYNLTMGFAVFAFYAIIEKVADLFPVKSVRLAFLSVFFAIPVVALTCFFGVSDKEDISFNLYYNEVNKIHSDLSEQLKLIGSSSSIAFSDESFYPYYLFRKDHPNAHRCAAGNEDYYIKRNYEPLPAGKENDYVKIKSGPEDYECYKRK